MTAVIIVPDSAELGRPAADVVVASLSGAAEPVIGVATGSSPLAIYAELARRVASGELDLSRARGFALDEYVGISPDDPRSYAYFVRTVVERELGMRPGAVRVPAACADDVDAAADDFEREIERVGVDIQILGVGTNGHVGFNEPGSSLSSRTRVKALAESTRLDNARFFAAPDDVPRLCVTQGLATILRARRLVLVATGSAKAAAIAAAVEGPVSSSCPASVIQLHPAATVVVDEAAAAELRHADYYRTAAALTVARAR